MKNIIVGLSLTLLCTGALSAQNSNNGTVGAQFLKIESTPRETGMGGIGSTLSTGVSGMFWNPASLVETKGTELIFSRTSLWAGIGMNHIGVSYNAGDIGAFGLSIITLSTDKIEITTVEQEMGTGLYYDASDFAVSAGYSVYLNSSFSVGVIGKYVSQRLWKLEASGFAIDLGTKYVFDFKRLTIGTTIKNFGTNMKYEGSNLKTVVTPNSQYPTTPEQVAYFRTEEYPIPLMFLIGTSMRVYENDFTSADLGADITKSNDADEIVNVGTEVSVFNRFFARGGYRINDKEKPYSFGFGAKLDLTGSIFTLDYSYSTHEYLDGIQRLSIGLSF